jgi:membrane associated rhomboid family serine protease
MSGTVDPKLPTGIRRSDALRADRALAALHESDRAGRPVVTYAFLALCLLVTVPTLVFPQLYDLLGGIAPRRHPWQLFTAAFEHGWPGFPGAVHLALNLLLILECGRPCERLLGSARFLALSLLALAANALALAATDGVNGSSLVIWAWGPALWLALRWAKRHDPAVRQTASYQRLHAILLLMYGILVLVMALLPYFFGWRGNPLLALLRANTFHLVATAVGVLFATVNAGYIRERMAELARHGHRAETGALDDV